jgi:UDP-hydrolysing UDP-N-acetyl-D-glucosamine 2-epimerase
VRKICVFSGKRGGFGAFVPLMRAIERDPQLELLILLADQHAAEQFGATAEEVRRAFPDTTIELVEMGTGRGDSPLVRAENLGACLAGSARVLARERPDVVVVHGDRGDHLMVAYAAVTLGIAVAHTQGGERSGNIDELQRHAISKLAHLHFPETDAAAERLRKMGEHGWRIHVVGSTYADRIAQGLYAPPDEARRAVGLGPDEPFLLVLVHPETSRSQGENRELAEQVLAGVRRTGLRAVATYPCSDPGYEAIVDALHAEPALVVRPNIDNDAYLGLMAGAEAIVGNSSAALVEAPYLRLPAVNVGRRQLGRDRDTNVVDVEADAAAIEAAIHTIREPSFRARLAGADGRLGDGRAAERIVEVLKRVDLDTRLLEKQLAY